MPKKQDRPGFLIGSGHYRWKQPAMISKEGYAKIRVGKTHPLADPNGYAYEHLVVWVAAGNPRPNRDQLIRHKNEDRLDNRLENLVLVSRPVHQQLNLQSLTRDALTGRFEPNKRS